MKDEYLIMQSVDQNNVKALRLCNYSERYNKNKNACVPCKSENAGGYAFPLAINS